MGRFPRVTHPSATRPEGLVRLACVRHAASVRSEPGSNSQVDWQNVSAEAGTFKVKEPITSACLVSSIGLASLLTPHLIPNAPAFDVSNSARRRLRIPSVFTISKSKLPRGRTCRKDEGSHRGDPVFFIRSVLQGRALYARDSHLSNAFHQFFCSPHQRDERTGERASDLPPLLAMQRHKATGNRGFPRMWRHGIPHPTQYSSI